MRAGIMSAGWWNFGLARQAVRTEQLIGERVHTQVAGWDVEEFERQQLRALVREVFFSGLNRAVRQVVLSPMEPETDVGDLCKQVGVILAGETAGDVACVDESRRAKGGLTDRTEYINRQGAVRTEDPREFATQLTSNLFWLRSRGGSTDLCRATSVQIYLEELRRKFEYSIVASPAATSNEPFTLARFADGIVLILSAQRTRRVSALKVKNSLGGVRLLGTVLCEREFPIPSGIYRRL